MSTPTNGHGTRALHDDQPFIAFTRTFRAPIEHVWAAVTESDRLARWIGNWTGDPAEGEVLFRMLFEGEDHAAERFAITDCEAPKRLRITSTMPFDGENPQIWNIRLDLSQDADVTTLTFAQSVPDPAMAEGVGPGWHYYLDRLVVAEDGADPATVVWDDYYPALAEHYRGTFA
ncbi:SRPBCC family protein [Ornithinimicrobium faecis]|uniref:SRPBCC family protein n=1 Tax=Ornithinimicrobium faecis TaxID=2934158 RepID=A0ABY4YR65_9MICO|nr:MULTISPECIES: SRPBCC family protein [unclassified Ornithinimicrobium]USQ79258.1 SRPBCC family protein [Ornithinimicrobium sp. HY1793]